MFPVKGLFLSFRMDFILGLFFLFNYIYISYWFYFYGETRLIYHINFFFFYLQISVAKCWGHMGHI